MRHPQITVEMVTPEIATEWLGSSRGNRSIRRHKVDGIARNMAANQFAQNGDTIGFFEVGEGDEEGTRLKDSKGRRRFVRLVDGHHRLMAIVKSNATVLMTVIWNVEDPRLKDMVTPRTYADALKIDHVQYASMTASAYSYLGAFMMYKIFRGLGGPQRPTRLDLYAARENNPDLYTYCRSYGKTDARKTIRVSGALLAVLHYLFHQVDAEKSDLFMTQLTEGTELKHGYPAKTFRDWLARSTTSQRETFKTEIQQHALANYIIYSWNKFIKGDPLYVINKIVVSPPICDQTGKAFSKWTFINHLESTLDTKVE